MRICRGVIGDTRGNTLWRLSVAVGPTGPQDTTFRVFGDSWMYELMKAALEGIWHIAGLDRNLSDIFMKR